MPLIQNPHNLDRALDLVSSAKPVIEGESKIRELLAQQGATLESAASNLAELAQNSRNEPTRLKATETVLRLHGISLKDDEGTGINVTFVVHGDQIKMQNILVPKKSL